MVNTHYDNLQVIRSASPEVIKGAYKHLTQRWHPDKNPDNRGEAEIILKAINRAYEVLSDPQLRHEYDQWISGQERDESANAESKPAPPDPVSSAPADRETALSDISLWNPSAAANWSLLFSPVFGAWLHAKNWTALGETKKASRSMIWVYAGTLVVLVAVSPQISDSFARAMGISFLLAWYFSSGKAQIKHVDNALRGAYKKKGWLKPLGLAGLSVASIILLIGLMLPSIDPNFQKETAISEISGVWQVHGGTTVVTFQLEGKNAIVKVDDEVFPVKIDAFESERKVLTLLATSDPPTTWSVRQVFDEENNFTLKISLDGGEEVDLSYVGEL